MDTAFSVLNALGDITGPAALVISGLLGALHFKNAGHITDLFNKISAVVRDVAVTAQAVRLNHDAVPLMIASSVPQIALDAGVPAKLVQQVQDSAGTAAAILPVGEALLEAEAPSVEEKAHAILDQVGQVIAALSGVTKQMQATAAAQAAAPGASTAILPQPAILSPVAAGG